MATSPSETETTPDDLPARIAVPEATTAETAAIAAAVGTYLRRRRVSAEAAPATGSENERRRGWQFAGRTEAVTGRAHRRPAGAPADDWTATARLEALYD
ncbi:MAG: acc operon protein [Salinirussus sp.]